MIVVAIGGLDPGGGAGLLRDALTATALGIHLHAVGTAWTEQGEGVVHRVEPRDAARLADAVRQAIGRRGLSAPSAPSAVKIGMVPDAARAAAIREALEGFEGPVVIDPVLATSRGGPLWAGPAHDLLPLLRRATLVTPNSGEAGVLAGLPVRDAGDAAAAGAALLARGVRAVLVKGGHLADRSGRPADPITDVLVTPEGTRRLSHPRLPGPSPRGTGCALALAIAVELGRGTPLEAAVLAATTWLAGAIARAHEVVPGGERHLG